MTPAFAHLNLRRNPFGELTRRELAEVELHAELPYGPDRIEAHTLTVRP